MTAIARIRRCLHGPLDEAEEMLSDALERLEDARDTRARTAEESRRLSQVVAKNHFREAVEFQLRGGRQ